MATPPKEPKGAPKRLPNGNYKHKYGACYPSPMPEWWLELHLWGERFDSGLDPVEHLRRYFHLVHPDCAWHEWREQRFKSLTDDEFAHKSGGITIRNVAWVGSGAAGKTNDAGDFAFAWWLFDPANSTVILTSTAKGKIKQRVWPLIQGRYVEAKQIWEEHRITGPHMLNSTMELQCVKGDSKHAVFAQAVEPGELAQAIEKVKGVHCPRIMLVIDEAPGTPEALFHCIPNMQKGCTELVVLSIGNGPMTHLDCFSRVCTPVGGWGAVSVDTDAWTTRAVPEFQLPKGRCLHFDGTKSPNVKARKTIFPFLYTWENWQLAQANPEFQRTAAFYSQDRGFWPPEGFLKTVLTEEQIERGNARGSVLFAGPTIPMGSLDSGFGGDNCTLRWGRRGKLADGRMAAQIEERIVIPILVDAVDPLTGKKIPAEYQIAKIVMEGAEKRNVKPEDFGIEATGTGRGAAAVLTQEWGEIVWVESGGRPSEMPASEEDPRPAREVYDRRITELWFSVQAFVKGSQIGGLTDDDVIQFCARQYDFVSKKYVLEKKEDLKPRLGRSPDDADALAIFIEVCRKHGMATQGPRGERMISQWDKEIKIQQRLYNDDSLYQPEESFD